MRAFFLVHPVCMAAVCLALLGTAFAPAQAEDGFLMPSGNIECIYEKEVVPDDDSPPLPSRIICSRAQPSFLRVILDDDAAPARIVQWKNGMGCCTHALRKHPYGTTWEQAPFYCDVETDGVHCFRRKNARLTGFRLSRAGVRFYDRPDMLHSMN